MDYHYYLSQLVVNLDLTFFRGIVDVGVCCRGLRSGKGKCRQ